MNAPFLLCLIACIASAVYARYLYNGEAAIEKFHADWRKEAAAYHLMHGPNSGCVECEDK